MAKELHALKESLTGFFTDQGFQTRNENYLELPGAKLHELWTGIDILDRDDAVRYSIFLGLSYNHAALLTGVLNDNFSPGQEEVYGTIMEVLNILAGHALDDLPPMPEDNYYMLAPPFVENAYLVDPALHRLYSMFRVILEKDNQPIELYFMLFERIK